ncbi:prepilin-type N-terminal cleavage/methylation domain-containing protein [Candidatus Parcubacteria bacterium]|nr:prepilin-type N-terminal cleavage/methylation domain-containing protein [Candidatus Parcubacteria bacterium]
MFKCLNAKKLKCEGFSLLEVLVAITVLIVGLVGAIGLIVYNVSISRASPEKIIAVNLAQEGIEVVRNIRDSNWLAGVVWDQDIPSGNSIPIFTDNNRNDWPSDPDKWRLSHIGAAESWKEDVYYDDIDKFYGQSKKQSTNPAQFPDDWISTIFTRKITITEFFVIDENPRKFAFIKIVMAKFWPDQVKVISQVDWTDRSGNSHTIILENHLYNWR